MNIDYQKCGIFFVFISLPAYDQLATNVFIIIVKGISHSFLQNQRYIQLKSHHEYFTK